MHRMPAMATVMRVLLMLVFVLVVRHDIRMGAEGEILETRKGTNRLIA